MIADCHMHTEFSTDSEADMELMAKTAIALGLDHICFTDHFDMDFPGGEFQLDTPAYMEKVMKIRERYQDRIYIGFGVELGMQEHLSERIRNYTAQYPFDYVIGSMHLLDGKDPYDGEIYKTLGDEQAFRRYFEATAQMLEKDMDINSLGHLDYVVRYGDYSLYSYKKYADEIDTILKSLIHRGIALEINTGGLRKMPFTNPHPDVIRRYRELGGELITAGADAHMPEHVGFAFNQVKDLLESCGFSYYTVFKQRKPIFLKI